MADTEKSTAVWYPTGHNAEYYAPEYECSNCGKLNHWSNYCPNCGRKMEDIPKPKKPIKAMWISGAKDPTGQYFEDEIMCNHCMHSEPYSYMFQDHGMICPKCGASMTRGPNV